MTKAEHFRNQSNEDLNSALVDHRKELFKLVNEAKLSRKSEKPHLLKTKKKEIARILTVMREKELQK